MQVNPTNPTPLGVNAASGVPSDTASKKTESSTTDKILEGLGKFADSVHRFGITITGILPFSTRGIINNLALMPFLLPIRSKQSIRLSNSGEEFIQKMKAYMKADWNQGIQDSYKDLELPKNNELRKLVVKENYRYALYTHKGQQMLGQMDQPGSEQGILFKETNTKRINSKALPTLNVIHDKLTNEMGFEYNAGGHYFHLETGVILNLVFDKERNEIVACFPGLGDRSMLNDDAGALKVNSECCKAIAADWFGGIPLASQQAIEIGKMLKETTANTDPKITPVMVGHSHGGGLAQTGAVANGLKGVVFNSRPMGAGTRRYIGQATIALNAKNITTFSGKGDWLSGTEVINRLAVYFERITGIPVPRSVGIGFQLPYISDENKKKSDFMYNHGGYSIALGKLKKMDENPKKEV